MPYIINLEQLRSKTNCFSNKISCHFNHLLVYNFLLRKMFLKKNKQLRQDSMIFSHPLISITVLSNSRATITPIDNATSPAEGELHFKNIIYKGPIHNKFGTTPCNKSALNKCFSLKGSTLN